MKNNLIIIAITGIVLGSGGFFAGIKYQQSRAPGFDNMSKNATMRQRPGGPAHELSSVRGSIISQDKDSLTIKMVDNSSKIILLSDLTKINTTSEASKEDLTIDDQVVIFGQTNSDGSVSAETIQIGSSLNQGARQ